MQRLVFCRKPLVVKVYQQIYQWKLLWEIPLRDLNRETVMCVLLIWEKCVSRIRCPILYHYWNFVTLSAISLQNVVTCKRDPWQFLLLTLAFLGGALSSISSWPLGGLHTLKCSFECNRFENLYEILRMISLVSVFCASIMASRLKKLIALTEICWVFQILQL